MLAQVGRGDLTFDAFERLLKFESNIPAQYTAPPSGLFLEKVLFKGDTAPIERKSVFTIG